MEDYGRNWSLVKYYYNGKYWTKKHVGLAVFYNWITKAGYKDIVGEDYTE